MSISTQTYDELQRAWKSAEDHFRNARSYHQVLIPIPGQEGMFFGLSKHISGWRLGILENGTVEFTPILECQVIQRIAASYLLLELQQAVENSCKESEREIHAAVDRIEDFLDLYRQPPTIGS